MWLGLEIVILILGFLLLFGGDLLALPILSQAGIACLGLGMIVTGWQAIITRRLVRFKRGHYRVAY